MADTSTALTLWRQAVGELLCLHQCCYGEGCSRIPLMSARPTPIPRISKVLSEIDRPENWCKAFREFAFTEATAGQISPWLEAGREALYLRVWVAEPS